MRPVSEFAPERNDKLILTTPLNMKKYFTLFALMLTALFSNINASAQDALTYITEIKSAYNNVTPVTGDIVINKNLNEGIVGCFKNMIMYKATDDFLHNKIITDIIAVRNYSESTITYNGVTYYKAAYQGGGYGNMNFELKNNGKDAPSLCLYVAKAIPALGDKVLTGIDVEICESAQTSGDYVPVMECSDGTTIPYGNNNLKNETESKFYVYLKPTYTTISYEAYPAIYKENCTEGSGTEDDPYLISTAGHLYWFSYMVATGNDDICGKLTTDITVNEGVLNSDGSLRSKTNLKPWFPIGYDNSHVFNGTLIGDGHTISGLYCEDVPAQSLGLVGCANDAKISGIGIIDSYFNSANKDAVGGIAGKICTLAKQTIIEKCYFQGTIGSHKYGGGIAGACLAGNSSRPGQINDCYSVCRFISHEQDASYGDLIGYIYIITESAIISDMEIPTAKLSNCYYDSDISDKPNNIDGITAKTSAQFASGEVASLLNHQVETGEEPFRQRIGTDKYPKFKDSNKNNYVFRTSDGGYTNQCPHVFRTQESPLQPSTCVNEGHIAYFYCEHPGCKAYYADFPGSVETTTNEVGLFRVGDTTPAVIKDKDGYRWTRTDQQLVNSNVYYNTMNLKLNQYLESIGTYSVLYPTWPLVNGANLFCHVDMKGIKSGKITLKVFVNKVELTEYRLVVNISNCADNTIKLEGISTNDQLEIDVVFEGVQIRTFDNNAYITIGVDKPLEETPAEHTTFTYVPGDNCLHEGLTAHYKCDRCGALFAADADNPKETDTERFKTDEYVVTKDELHRPAYESHLFSLAQQPNGLYADHCDRCNHIDTESWVAKEAIGGEDLHLTGNDTEGFSTAEEISLAYGMDYTVPVPFTAPSVDYTVPVYAKGWSSWSVPFEVTTNQLAEEGFDAAYIEGIHRYDTDDDGTIDRTTLEVIRITNGTLRAGTPYLIRPQEDKTTLTLTIDGAALHKAGELHPINTATALAAYDFVPTYVTVPAEEAEGNYYIIGAENKLGPTSSHVCALDWYLKITDKGSPFDALQGAQSIAIRTVGEQDGITGIFTPYAPDEQTEEIYDLSGRRLDTVPAQGLYIQGNKVKMGK